MKAIVIVDKNWAIGCQNALLAHIPSDLKFFKNKTLNNIIVYGRKTLETFPNGKPLKNRVNILLTRDPKYRTSESSFVVNSIDEILQMNSEIKENLFVVGGQSVYEQLLPYCDTVYVTKIDEAFPADAYFPNLDLDNSNWTLVTISEKQEENGFTFYFCEYKRIYN